MEKIQNQTPGAGEGGDTEKYPGPSNAHQGVQNGPDDGKDNRGRGQGRLCDRLGIELNSRPGQPAGQGAHCLGKKDPGGINVPSVLAHIYHPELAYAKRAEICVKYGYCSSAETGPGRVWTS